MPQPREGEQCQYPSCGEPPLEDLCRTHSSKWGRTPVRLRDANLLPNDGYVDWVAVEVAAQGIRPLRLTWIERELAAAMIYAWGHGPEGVRARLGGWEPAKSRWRIIWTAIGADYGRVA